jgi:hypothetical protein
VSKEEELTMADHIAFARGPGIACPYLVALDRAQRSNLVSMGLRDPGYTGVHARTHHHMTFHVQPSTYQLGDRILIRRWLEVGFFAGFGGIVFVDETAPDGDDWAWLAKHQDHIDGLPPVYFKYEMDQVQFPPRMVMTIDMVREVVLEWVETGQRPTSVEWVPVNDYQWKLDGLGDIAQAPDMA